MAKKVDSVEELEKLNEEFGVKQESKLKQDVKLESQANAAISVLEKKRRSLVDYYKNEEVSREEVMSEKLHLYAGIFGIHRFDLKFL